METEGTVRPATPEAANETYAALVATAKVATREATKAMAFDREEYADRVTSDVIASVRDAIFASLLEVHVADRETFDDWLAERDREPIVTGSDHAPRVVWHAPAFDDRVVAATFVEKREAAVGTLRRQAFGRIYRDVLDDPSGPQTTTDDASDERDVTPGEDTTGSDGTTPSDDASDGRDVTPSEDTTGRSSENENN